MDGPRQFTLFSFCSSIGAAWRQALSRRFGNARHGHGGNKRLMATTRHWKLLPVLPTFRVLHSRWRQVAMSGDARPPAARPTRLELPVMDEILKAKRQQAGAAGRAITIRGAREHNLKNIDVEIPRDRLVVFTGLSGSGKSSLAFDTIYAEGQRRYVESLSAYARQFLEMMQKPDVDQIDGLSPAISIEQKTTSRNPRSTVGTVTEIYDYMRLL